MTSDAQAGLLCDHAPNDALPLVDGVEAQDGAARLARVDSALDSAEGDEGG